MSIDDLVIIKSTSKEGIYRGFIISWTKDSVICKFIEEFGTRKFNTYPFFAGERLFKGKNFWLEETREVNSLTMTYHPSKKPILMQLWNYYIKKTFSVK